MGQRTPIYPLHVEAGAKMVDFGGWDMPIHYGSQIEEHHAVRRDVGICDVSHMTVVDVAGKDARAFLRHLLANDVARLDAKGKALYSPMLNEAGGILDDLIVYRGETDASYRLVVNCATRDKDLKWIAAQSSAFDVEVKERQDLAILAVQGPNSLEHVKALLDADGVSRLEGLVPFTSADWQDWMLARTGYTGEVGIEIILPGEAAPAVWRRLTAAGVAPVGLGARDTLRLEAGMNLYGQDMDETVTPYESNIAFTVVLDDHEFVGATRLREQKVAGAPRRLTGLVMTTRGVLRAHYPVFAGDQQVGEITSGAFSPTLSHSIALARLDQGATGDLAVSIRGKMHPVIEVRPPFVRNGKQVYKPARRG
ncbi:MAG: glycine cleavage system aminomethyltransferase GcvT [Pseudomonadales bacterium]|nr:glycine cleavage system aminomethyltransferase GcvT [Pseudomonadales bacterium]